MAMATVPLLAWRAAVKWFPDNGTPERRRERERKRMRPNERTNGREEMSGQRQRKDGIAAGRTMMLTCIFLIKKLF